MAGRPPKLRNWVLRAMPAMLPVRALDMMECGEIEGFHPESVRKVLFYLAEDGLLVKLAPGLYRRPTNHEAKP